MNQSNETSPNPMSFAHALGLMFIGLKLAKIIKWSWLWVVAPLWAPIILIPALRKANEWAIEAGEKAEVDLSEAGYDTLAEALRDRFKSTQRPYTEPLDPNF